ncbi:MAG: hypothetical protein JSS49_16440 [Planctomycetes bacterium]|nr:hypothetical protein [Planctomycetota bacterium]
MFNETMQDVTRDNFGLLIAYVLPGFVTLWGVSFFSGTVRHWLGTSSQASPTVGGFLYVTVAAVATGLLVSTIRWMTVDRIHHVTGIPMPNWDFAKLGNSLSAFELLVSAHYRFYQWHANMLVAIAFAFFSFAVVSPLQGLLGFEIAISFIVVEIVLWLGSRDTLRKYYERTAKLVNGYSEHAEEDSHPTSS